MKFYTIYGNSTGNYKAVKQGWSWPAFLFTGVWAIVKGVWQLSTLSVALLAVVCIATFIIVGAMSQTNLLLIVDLLTIYMSYLALALSFIMGAKGNQWILHKLSIQGYQHKDIIGADTPATAMMLYIREKDEKSLMRA